MDDIISVVQVIIALLLVLCLVYISLKLGNKWMKRQHPLIEILERVPVTNNSYLGIVKVGDSYYLMSLTNGENTILKELNQEKVLKMMEEVRKVNKFSVDFNDLFGMRK
ncbi:MAG: flagellar biosynthetic protein FliO [Eubacteriales bacterium]